MRLTWIMMSVVCVAACGGESRTVATTPKPTRAKRRAPLPNVPADYAEAKQRTARVAREVVELMRQGKSAELYAMFTPAMKKAVPSAALAKGMPELVKLLSGATLAGTSVVAGRYAADYSLGPGKTVALLLAIDPTGKVAGMSFRPRPRLPADPMAGHHTRARLRLPFRGTWWVLWGGNNLRVNYHLIAPDQRYAFDLVIWRDGTSHRGDGKRNADYWAYGKPILAPADARVVAVVTGVADNRPGVMNPKQPAGNHVILDLGNSEYALLAHLQHGSVRVNTGDTVKRGQVLGLCGNSGNSSEPHLHFHLQNAPGFGKGNGIPSVFTGYAADGKRVVEGSPVQGQFITPLQ